MKPKLNILFNDHHLVAVNKPARIGIASDSSQDETQLEVIRQWNSARQDEGRKGYCVPIHFLDRPVSGVVIFALSSKAATRLNEQFRNRKVNKTYAAIVEGQPPETKATLEHWLAKDRKHNKSFIARKDEAEQKFCRLSYELLAKQGSYSLLLVTPETGRSHQIRTQLAAAGFPVAGDVKYGARPIWQGRIALHALELTITHPVSKEPLVLQAPPPNEWQDLWQNLHDLLPSSSPNQ